MFLLCLLNFEMSGVIDSKKITITKNSTRNCGKIPNIVSARVIIKNNVISLLLRSELIDFKNIITYNFAIGNLYSRRLNNTSIKFI